MMGRYFSLLAAILLLSACTTVQVSKPPDFSCSPEIVVSKDSRCTVPATGGSTTFLDDDHQAVARLSCSNLHGSHTVRWEWYANGLPYQISREVPFSSPERTFKRSAAMSHAININGEAAAEKTGNWQVRAYLDGKLIGEKKFTIATEPDLIEQVRKLPQMQSDAKRHALIIGIEKYSETVSAKYADRDALLMKEFFIRRYGVPERNVTLMMNEQATLGRMRGMVENRLQALGKDDTLFIYYSGHGTAVPDRDGNSAAVPYIIPDGTVTVGKLFDQIKETVNDASLKLYGLSRAQTPTMRPQKDDERRNLLLWSKE
jgi:hypothetical protein